MSSAANDPEREDFGELRFFRVNYLRRPVNGLPPVESDKSG
jgi:hypothetical protein